MSTPYIGEIRLMGFNFAPIGWVPCDGRLLQIAVYDALFSLIGTTYGGDGNSTFAVPDMRGRVALHQGTGPGLPSRVIGQASGQSTASVTAAQMPAHSHQLTGPIVQAATSAAGTTAAPGGNIPAGSAAGENYAPASAADGTLAPIQVTGSLQATGGGAPIDLMPPYLAFNYCMSTEGIYPSQN